MAHLVICDRCGQPADWSDARAYDLFREETPSLAGQDICQRCAERIDLAGQLGRLSAAAGVSPQQYLSDWLKLYEEPQHDQQQ